MRCWSIEVDGPLITMTTGDVGGAMTSHERWCEGKNIGRRNETTDEAQAKKEARAVIAAKRKEGWCGLALKSVSVFSYLLCISGCFLKNLSDFLKYSSVRVML